MYIFGGRGDLYGPYHSQEEIYSRDIMYLDTHTGMWHKPITHGDIPVGRRSHSACKSAFKHILQLLSQILCCFVAGLASLTHPGLVKSCYYLRSCMGTWIGWLCVRFFIRLILYVNYSIAVSALLLQLCINKAYIYFCIWLRNILNWPWPLMIFAQFTTLPNPLQQLCIERNSALNLCMCI